MTPEPTVNDMMEAYALDAIDHARRAFERKLDFSAESVEQVEAILTEMYDLKKPKGFLSRLLRATPSEEVLWTFSKMYGAYVGEVLRRLGGGEWYLDEEVVPGQRTIGLRKNDHRVWPPSKVGKRLFNGPEDNVWHYFQIVAQSW